MSDELDPEQMNSLELARYIFHHATCLGKALLAVAHRTGASPFRMMGWIENWMFSIIRNSRVPPTAEAGHDDEGITPIEEIATEIDRRTMRRPGQ